MYDLAIIGAGAAGVACAHGAIRRRLKAVLIDKAEDQAGGTCLNRGCIPTKFFLNSSKTNRDWTSVSRESKKTIENIRRGLLQLLKNKGVTTVFGSAAFIDKNRLAVNNETIEAKNFIIATGSKPISILSHPKAICAEDIFSRDSVPDKFLIVGAGYIGVEFACLFNELGKDVLIIEKLDDILPNLGSSLTGRLRVILEKKGIKIETKADLSSYNLDDFDMVIWAVGRKPCLDELAPGKAGVLLDDKGWVKVDKSMRTNVDNIYCCGDANGRKMLAYAAQYQADICIDSICATGAEEDYTGFAECVFSFPQVAKVGICEKEAIQKNIKYKAFRSNFLKFSSSYVYKDNDGFMEVLAGPKGEIIGAAIISNQAAELISLFSLAIRHNISLKKLSDSVFIHPTLSEIIPALLKELE